MAASTAASGPRLEYWAIDGRMGSRKRQCHEMCISGCDGVCKQVLMFVTPCLSSFFHENLSHQYSQHTLTSMPTNASLNHSIPYTKVRAQSYTLMNSACYDTLDISAVKRQSCEIIPTVCTHTRLNGPRVTKVKRKASRAITHQCRNSPCLISRACA